MAQFLFIESKAINLDNVAYVDLDPYGTETIGITMRGNHSGVYDFTLSGVEAEDFLLKLEAVKVAAA